MDNDKKQIKPMDCPVCGKFYFTKLHEAQIEAGITPDMIRCLVCGWCYDLEQTENPDLTNGANEMSLNQYREWFKNKRKEHPRWEYVNEVAKEKTKHPCPVCGEYTFKDLICADICPVCGWEDTGFEDVPDERPNDYMMSLNEHKKWFAEKRKEDPDYWWDPSAKKKKKAKRKPKKKTAEEESKTPK